MPLAYSINQDQRNFAVKHGIFRIERVPYSFADYFLLRYPELQNDFPFLRVMWRHLIIQISMLCRLAKPTCR